MDEPTTDRLCDKAASIKYLCPKKTMKEVMAFADFNDNDIGIDRYRKRIERKLKLLKTRHGSTLHSPPKPVNFITTFRSPLTSSLSNSNSNLSSMTRTTTTVTTTKSTSSRKTSKQVVKENAVKSIETQKENEAFQMAMSRWEKEKQKPKYHRTTGAKLVKQINVQMGTNICERTVRRYSSKGLIGVLPRWGGGIVSIIPTQVLKALDLVVSSYIQLTNAGMVKDVNRQIIIQKLGRCLKKGGIQLKKLDKVYEAMMKRLGDKIVINDANNMVEQRSLEWTTYSNIDLWFY